MQINNELIQQTKLNKNKKSKTSKLVELPFFKEKYAIMLI